MDEETPDIYTDGITLSTGPYGVTLVLFRSEPPKVPNEGTPGLIVGRVRMSAELARALGELIDRAIVRADAPETGSKKSGSRRSSDSGQQTK